MKGLVVLSLVVACSFAPKPPPAPPRTTKLGLQLEQLELTNGLRVILVHDRKAREVQVTMRYRVGAVDDPGGQAGIAHLVEHLMFQQILGSQSLYAHLEAGATYFNGITTHDATTYIARASVDHLDELLSIESVRVGLRCTSISDSAFEREREVVVNELRVREEAAAVRGALERAAYPDGHPYHAEVGGTPASVAALSRAQACAFADAHYAPSNAVLVVSGDITADQIQTALKKFMTHVPRRAVTPQVDVPALKDVGTGAHATIEAPIPEDALLVAWPVPAEPQTEIRMRALAETVARLVDEKIKGRVQLVTLGDTRAPMLGLVVVPDPGEGEPEVMHAVESASNNVGGLFESDGLIPWGQLALDRIQQTAVYELFASLDDLARRDSMLATEVLAGRDPEAALAAEFRGLRELTRGEATIIAAEYLGLRHARIATLHASGPKRGGGLAIATAIHDLGQRREPPDPALANAPLAETAPPPDLERMRTRTLPNGMRVVLLPLTSVPTVDARVIFASGTGDDPPDRRGVAMLAGDLLSWDLRYLDDLLSFASAGGVIRAEVALDRTTFTARGLDMHLDFLLAGLRRVVRDGRYEDIRIAPALHRETKRLGDEGAFSDAYRAALYGEGHPYVAAGVVRRVDARITKLDLERFRASHLDPANATLVIAGHFDANLADRWIDFLFADWTAAAPAPRLATPAEPRPATLARYEDTAQVALTIAIPLAPSTDLVVEAKRLVVAEMLDALAEDVRHQLGATYGLDASLASARLAADYILTGSIEAARTTEALQLLAQRVAALRDDPEVAARAFVAARARVVTRLRSLAGGASTLADRVEVDAGLARPPLSELATATRVAQLTVDQLAPALADLEPKRAVISLRGPETAITPALAVLQRTAVVIAAPPVVKPVAPGASEDPPAPPAPAPAKSEETSQHLTANDLEDAITGEPPVARLAGSIGAGYTFGSVNDLDIQGVTVVGELGYRFDAITTLGLHLELGDTFADYTSGISTPVSYHLSVLPVEVGGFARGEYHWFWAGAFLAIHYQRISDGMSTEWTNGVTAGLETGVDLYRFGTQRVGLYGRLQSVLLTDAGFDVFTLGVAIRR